VLGLFTGQRASDLVKMMWSDFDGDGIAVTQKKTGTSLWLPCHLELRKELEVWKIDRTTMTILSRPSGQPYSATALSSAMSKMIARCQPKLLGLRFHGLRMTAAAKLAEAGCSVHEIASITGHKSLQMIEHYTAGADQIRRAKAAIVKLEQYSAN
jgi:integrase